MKNFTPRSIVTLAAFAALGTGCYAEIDAPGADEENYSYTPTNPAIVCIDGNCGSSNPKFQVPSAGDDFDEANPTFADNGVDLSDGSEESAGDSVDETAIQYCDADWKGTDAYDMNQDGSLSQDDVQCLTTTVLTPATEELPACFQKDFADADLNEDGAVNVLDVQTLSTLIANQAGDCETYGDLNADQASNVMDTVCMNAAVQWFATGADASAAPSCLSETWRADLNCDEDINVLDIMILSRVVLGQSHPDAIDADQNGVHDSCEAATPVEVSYEPPLLFPLSVEASF